MAWNPHVVGDALFWMFVNLMVGVALVSLAAYPPLWRPWSSPPGRYWRDVVAASVMAIFCMIAVWSPGPGMKMDIRMVPLGLAGMTYGLPAAAMVGAAIIIARALMGGGTGLLATVVYTSLCVALVPLFHRRPKKLGNLALLGLAQQLVGFAAGRIVYGANQPPGLEPTSPIWLGLAVIQIISLWVVNFQVENLNAKQELQSDLSRALNSKEAMLQVVPHAIFVLDGDGRLLDANEAAHRLIGGNSLPPDVVRHPEVAASLKRHQRISGCRVTVGDRIMLVSTVPLDDGSILLGMENVTTVVRQEREEARRDRLELLGRMAAMAAHEIKNPLTTIKGFLQLMSGRPEFAVHRGTFALVQGEVEHINRVVGDFLDLSRSSSPQPQKVDVDTTKSTGTGLGLAISHKLAAELGAELSVDSAPGKGTTFRLTLPEA